MLNLQWTEASSCSICSPLSPSGNSLSVILFIVGSIAPPVGWLVDDDSSPMEIIYFTCFLSRFMSNKNGFFSPVIFTLKKFIFESKSVADTAFRLQHFYFQKFIFLLQPKGSIPCFPKDVRTIFNQPKTGGGHFRWKMLRSQGQRPPPALPRFLSPLFHERLAGHEEMLSSFMLFFVLAHPPLETV